MLSLGLFLFKISVNSFIRIQSLFRFSLKEMEGGGGKYWATSTDTDREFTLAFQIALSHGSSTSSPSSNFPSTPLTPPTTTTFPKPTVPVVGVQGRKTFKRKTKRSASLLPSTRYLDTDIFNFKEMVQQFTGIEGDGIGFKKQETTPVKFVRKQESCIPMLDTSANLFNYGTKEHKFTFPPPATTPEFPLLESLGWEDLLGAGISDSLPSVFLPSPACGGTGNELLLTPPVLETGISSIVPVPDVGVIGWRHGIK